MIVRPRIVSRIACGSLFVFAGICHFAKPDLFLRIMPPYIPYPLEFVYISGAIELLAGLGLQWPKTRIYAAWKLLVLLVVVFPVNMEMALHPERFPGIPAWFLLGRLPLQPILMAWVWSCRKPD